MLERQCSQKCRVVGIMASILQIEKLNFRVVRNYRHIVILSSWPVEAKPSVSFWLYYYASTTLCIPGVILLTSTNLIIEMINSRNQGNMSFSSCHDKPRDINLIFSSDFDVEFLELKFWALFLCTHFKIEGLIALILTYEEQNIKVIIYSVRKVCIHMVKLLKPKLF